MRKFLVLLLVSLFGASVFAQDVKNVYPQYTMWSNWMIGVNAGVVSGNNFDGFGVDLTIDKELSYVFDFRSNIGYRYVCKDGRSYVPVTFGGTADFINMFAKDKHYRDVKVYGIAMLGFGVNTNGYVDGFGSLMYDGKAGLGFQYNVTERFGINVESTMDCIGDAGSYKGGKVYNFTTFGVKYNLGISKVDKYRFEVMEMLALEEAETMQNIKSTAEENYNRVDTLMHKILHLEHMVDVYTMTDRTKDSIIVVRDSTIHCLHSILNNMRDNQLNEYALPFSVIFDVSSYEIREDQYTILNQVAKVMKDSGEKYKIVGFASSDGSDKYNMWLSEKRVNAVLRYLKRKGVNTDNIEVDYVGEDVLFGDGRSNINRRVSFYRVF